MHLHAYRLPRTQTGDRMMQMEPEATGVTDGRKPGRLSPCVCSTLRMVSRAVTQLYDDILRPSGLRVTQFSILATIARSGEAHLRQLEAALAIDQTTLTRSLSLLQRDRVIERMPHPDGRIKAVRLTRKGRRMLDVARPLWARHRTRCSASSARRHGMTASADWPACFTSRWRDAAWRGVQCGASAVHPEGLLEIDHGPKRSCVRIVNCSANVTDRLARKRVEGRMR